MGAKYDLLKLATVAGTVFSVYNAFTDRLLLEDLLMIILAAILLIAIAKDLGRTKNRHEEKTTGIGQKGLAKTTGIMEKKGRELQIIRDKDGIWAFWVNLVA